MCAERGFLRREEPICVPRKAEVRAREIEAAAAKIDGGADALRIDGEDSSEIAGSSTDSSFTPDDADGPAPYDYMAIVLAVAWRRRRSITRARAMPARGAGRRPTGGRRHARCRRTTRRCRVVRPRSATRRCAATAAAAGDGGARRRIAAATVAGAFWMARRHRFGIKRRGAGRAAAAAADTAARRRARAGAAHRPLRGRQACGGDVVPGRRPGRPPTWPTKRRAMLCS